MIYCNKLTNDYIGSYCGSHWGLPSIRQL